MKSPNKWLFLPLAGKQELNKLDDFVTGQSLRSPEWREVLNVLNDIVHLIDELLDIGVLGLKQDTE